MVKSEGKSLIPAMVNTRILITQPKPSSEKSPYYDLAKKHNAELVFHPFIKLEGLSAKEFRKQKIDISKFSAVIFTSRNAIDHFFRMCEEMKISVSQDTKYFCVAEAIALYLQKFILYRKRKVFFGADGTNKSIFDVINKHKENENFLYVCSENQQDSDIVNWLKANNCSFELGFMYRTVSNDIKSVMDNQHYDIICFFTPSGIRCLLDSYPDFGKTDTLFGTFGSGTFRACGQEGLKASIVAPAENTPNMAVALDQYLTAQEEKAVKKAKK
ncbi:uroporphyrinogen-III synthase [Arachidicoccus rhizosphaerae]|uniref:Uroporphyrinogen-III synthase n=1 Tax=Arachidicoccus rhizosphaerae TaxID=551991 RepID=A0A1H4C205_9BACT|nr:uroporphyrinogen-III synthase [Arachidicoccus rhizosphaerae]SEA54112.1 uroporphyrinogen-III synthase [Arachidicoccus rhizosphaerae]